MNRSNSNCRVYEPQILKTMGIAFDAAWDVLSKDRKNQDAKNRDVKRLELSSILFRLVDGGESDALRICKLALDKIIRPDIQRIKKQTHSDLADWIGLRSSSGRIGTGPHVADYFPRFGKRRATGFA